MRTKKKGDTRKAKGKRSPSPATNSKSKSLLSEFNHYNRAVATRKGFAPGASYSLYVLSTAYMAEWARKGRLPEARANEALLHGNPLGLKVKSWIEGVELPLRNNLDIDDEFEPVTNEAWNFLSAHTETIPFRRRLVFESFGFIESQVLSVNIFAKKEDSVEAALVVGEVDGGWPAWLQKAGQALGCKGPFRLFRLETQRPEELSSAVSDNTAAGIEVTDFKAFDPRYLKDQDSLMLVFGGGEPPLAPGAPPELSTCHGCEAKKPCSFICDCKIVSFCSLGCKVGDLAAHRRVCAAVSGDFADDLARDEAMRPCGPPSPRVGLVNIGNFCYTNAILQVLKFEPTLREKSESLREGGPAAGFWHSMRALWTAKPEDPPRPWGVKLAIGLSTPHYLSFGQQDSHEALISLLNVLDEADPASKEASLLFRGEFQSKIVCTRCANIITTSEPFLSLSLPIVAEKKKIEFSVLVADPKCPFLTKRHLFSLKHAEIAALKFREELAKLGAKPDSQILMHLSDREKTSLVSVDVVKEIVEEKTKSFDKELFVQSLAAGEDLHYLSVSLNEMQPSMNKNMPIRSRFAVARLLPFQHSPELPLSRSDLHFLLLKSLANLSEETSPLSKVSLEAFKHFLGLPDSEAPEDEPKESMETLAALLGKNPWEISFFNKAGSCPNCFKKGPHSCKFPLLGELTAPKEPLKNPIELSVEVRSPPLLKALKAALEHEKNQPPPMKKAQGSSTSLSSCLESFSDQEKIGFECEKCSNPESLIMTRIAKTPTVLVIHLKRFLTVFKDNEFTRKKNNELVDWEADLRINDDKYELFGVVNHSGELNSGHYTSFAKDFQANRWLFFNDEEVEELKSPVEMKSSLNYLMFFRKIS